MLCEAIVILDAFPFSSELFVITFLRVSHAFWSIYLLFSLRPQAYTYIFSELSDVKVKIY